MLKLDLSIIFCIVKVGFIFMLLDLGTILFVRIYPIEIGKRKIYDNFHNSMKVFTYER